MLACLAAGLLSSTHSRNGLLTLGGTVFLLAGAACGLFGAVALGRNLTPFPRAGSGARLVCNGIYRLMRHPLYAALMYASFGWALFRGSWPACITAAALTLFLNAKARREEQWLLEQFPAYSDYAQRVKRFIPGIY